MNTSLEIIEVPCDDDEPNESHWLTEAELEQMFGPHAEEPAFEIPLVDVFDALAKGRKLIAYHEAGHAVVAFALLGKSSTVEIGGGCGFAAQGDADHLSVSRFDAVLEAIRVGRAQTERWVDAQPTERIAATHFMLEVGQQIALAGPLAHSRVSGVPLARLLEAGAGGAEDLAEWEHLQQLLARIRHADRERDWERIEAATSSLLAERWSAVERLAGELVDRGRMSAGEVEAVLR